MQKLDLIYHLRRISIELRSPQIAAICRDEVATVAAGNRSWDSATMLPLLIESKSRYDALTAEEEPRRLLATLGASEVYATDVFAELMKEVSKAQNTHNLYFGKFFNVYAFHDRIQRLLELVTNVLIDDSDILDGMAGGTGLILFHVADRDDLTTLTLSRILTLIGELVALVEKLTAPETNPTEATVVLLDSGSSAAIGLKTSVETAKTIGEVFREMWQWWVYRKHFDNKVTMESFATNLSVLKLVKDAEVAGTLTPEKAKEYSTLIQRKTDSLIELRVVPREIALDQSLQQQVRLLGSATLIKSLPAANEQPPQKPADSREVS